MPTSLSLKNFLQQSGPILDVRSPLEFEQGHLPGSINFPLFTDAERSQVGTIYKKKSKQDAIELSLAMVTPRLDSLIEHAYGLLAQQPGRILCWRGGMRSGFIAHLLESVGVPTFTLQGGYKAFRRHTLQIIQHISNSPARLILVGGLTGSGKTEVLQALHHMGEQVIDLENLACHRGSSFGNIDLISQPSQEQFENQLAWEWQRLDLSRSIWLEDEGRLIGKCHLPSPLFHKMQAAPLFFIECPEEQRINRLMKLYGQASTVSLLQATYRIAKRLGGQLTKEIEQAFETGQRPLAFKKLLTYYDRTYHYQIQKRPTVHSLEKQQASAIEWARYLKQLTSK